MPRCTRVNNDIGSEGMSRIENARSAGLAQRIVFAVYFGWFLAVGLMFLKALHRSQQQNAQLQ